MDLAHPLGTRSDAGRFCASERTFSYIVQPRCRRVESFSCGHLEIWFSRSPTTMLCRII